MLDITIESVLKLPVMDGCKLLAGQSGLTNVIHSVTVYDNIPTATDTEIMTFDGDIYITSLFFGKEDPHFIVDFISSLYRLHASAIFVIDEFICEIPQEAVDFCNAHGLPVILIDRKTPYSLIISGIMEYKLMVQQRKSIENNLKALTSHSISQTEKETLIYDLNPNFQSHVLAVYCSPPIDFAVSTSTLYNTSYVSIINRISKYPTYFASEYRRGLLIVLSKKSSLSSEFENSIESVITFIHTNIPQCKIGISDIHSSSDLGKCISQAYMAASADSSEPSKISRYCELGIEKLLIASEGNPMLEEFYQEVITPITVYDQKHHTELLHTLFVFVKNNMDYTKTCADMFLHENTVRYRIGKIKELIPYGKNDMDFLVTLSVVYKIHKLLPDNYS